MRWPRVVVGFTQQFLDPDATLLVSFPESLLSRVAEAAGVA